MAKAFRRIETKLVHAGEPEPRLAGAVVTPIFQTAMYETAGESSYHAIRYIRLNNSPNHLVLHQKLAALENAEAALVAGSGISFGLPNAKLATPARDSDAPIGPLKKPRNGAIAAARAFATLWLPGTFR